MKSSLKKRYENCNVPIESIYKILQIISVFATIFLIYQQIKIMEDQNRIYNDQLNLMQEEFNYQYKPQILIELISPRKNAAFTPNGYEEPNVISIYNNDFSRSPLLNGSYAYDGSFSFPLKIKFYNFGSVGTKIEKIESKTNCSGYQVKSWQMDVMQSRVLIPQDSIEYNLFWEFEKFFKKPENYTWCDYQITYTFYNGFAINQTYLFRYYPFDYSSKNLEIEAYEKYIEDKHKDIF